MRLLDLVVEKRPEILRIAAKHGARDVRLFGSVARGEEHEGSDIDLLAEFDWQEEDALKEDLRRLLNRKVDVVQNVHPFIRERVEAEAIPLEAEDFSERAVIESQRPHMALDRDKFHLSLMREAIEAVAEYVAEGQLVFDSQRVYRDAIIMQLINIGEQANHLSRKLREERPDVAWGEIIGFRNIAVHNYPNLGIDKVWTSASVDVPRLKAQLEDLLESAG